MIIPNELKTILSLINNGMIFIYIAIFLVFSYLFVSLLTWSFIKPLKYLGIPTIIVGALFLILRFIIPLGLTIIKVNSIINPFESLLPSILKPILLSGIICLGSGIIMIVIYNIINKKDNTIDKALENSKN